MYFNGSTDILYLLPNSNTYVGTYTFTYKAWLVEDTALIATTYLSLEIVDNQPPYLVNFTDWNVTIYAHHSYNWSL